MAPALSMLDVRDLPLGHTKPIRDNSSCPTENQQFADDPDVVLGKASSVMLFPPKNVPTTFRVHVGHVVGNGPEE